MIETVPSDRLIPRGLELYIRQSMKVSKWSGHWIVHIRLWATGTGKWMDGPTSFWEIKNQSSWFSFFFRYYHISQLIVGMQYTVADYEMNVIPQSKKTKGLMRAIIILLEKAYISL